MKKTGSLLARLGLKNEPRLKIFSVLYDKKIYLVHKQSESRPEIAFY